MTHLPLNLDGFEHVFDKVEDKISAIVNIAYAEIKDMCEHQRRSLGQRVRWIEWRMAK